jgi:hypothetical protein
MASTQFQERTFVSVLIIVGNYMNTPVQHDPEHDQWLMETFSRGAFGMIVGSVASMPQRVVSEEATLVGCVKCWLSHLEQQVSVMSNGGV